VITFIYVAAALVNLRIPDTGARYPRQHFHPRPMLASFGRCVSTLWRDKLGQISLAVTTLFWGAGATLQFIILKWCETVLGMTLSQGAIMQAVVAIGIAIGSVTAAARVSLKRSLSVLPVGVAMGLLVCAMALVDFSRLPAGGLTLGSTTVTWAMALAAALMVVVGALAGYFVVPMNALLQHRGHVLLSAGHSIAVQNFNENLSILVMLGVYALLIAADLHIQTIIILFGLFVSGTMVLVILRHRHNQRQFDWTSLIGQAKH
jgi:LPLT family lysophospholipid transporter-like MFS transporter